MFFDNWMGLGRVLVVGPLAYFALILLLRASGNRTLSKMNAFDLIVTVADPGDPTADPSKAWPDGRRSVNSGTLTVDRTLSEADGPCREINFDPSVLPDGMRTSDDPFPAARSAAYAVSYDRRLAEAADYPRNASPGAHP